MAITITKSIPNQVKLREKAISLVGNQYSNRPKVKDDGKGEEVKPPADVKMVYEQIVKKLDNIEKKYSTDYIEPEVEYDKTLGLEEIKYQEPSREKAITEAKQVLEPDYTEDKAKVEKELQSAQNKADNQILSIKQQTQQKIDSLSNSITDKLEKIKKNAIDKGVARSSIVESEKEHAQYQVDDTAEQLRTQADNEIELLERNIQLAQEQAQQALDTLKQSYDAEVLNRITEILDKAIKEKIEAIKYNNTISEKESKYQITRQNAINKAKSDELDRQSAIYDMIEQYGGDTVNKRKSEEKYQVVKSYIDTLSKQDALKLCQSTSAIKHHLGDMYNSLIEYIINK